LFGTSEIYGLYNPFYFEKLNINKYKIVLNNIFTDIDKNYNELISDEFEIEGNIQSIISLNEELKRVRVLDSLHDEHEKLKEGMDAFVELLKTKQMILEIQSGKKVVIEDINATYVEWDVLTLLEFKVEMLEKKALLMSEAMDEINEIKDE
jgi:hypothetical protein